MTDDDLATLNALDAADVQAIVAAAIDRYVAARHARVRSFVDANYGLRGSFRLHRFALGSDLLRAPVNVALIVPHLLLQLSAAGARRLGAAQAGRWLADRQLFLTTDVARELTRRLYTDLLELPYPDGDDRSDRDALAEEMLADARLATAVDVLSATLSRRGSDPRVRERLAAALDTYAGARNAAAELVVNVAMAGVGATLFKQLTPGALSLGPALAAAVAHQAAVAGFPLGVALGGVWYGLVGTTPSAALVAGATGGLMAVVAMATAFAGVLGDPVQRALGLHQRRLHKLIDAIGDVLRSESEVAYRVRDHYAARIFDLVDVARATYRLATG